MFTQSQNINVKAIAEYLKEQLVLLQRVYMVLQEEHEALEKRKIDNLEEISQRKSDLMLKIQANDQRIRLHPDVSQLKTKYTKEIDDIENKLKECKELNTVNGKLIELSLAANHRLSQVLMGSRDRGTFNMTYNDKGAPNARGLARVNTQA